MVSAEMSTAGWGIGAHLRQRADAPGRAGRPEAVPPESLTPRRARVPQALLATAVIAHGDPAAAANLSEVVMSSVPVSLWASKSGSMAERNWTS